MNEQDPIEMLKATSRKVSALIDELNTIEGVEASAKVVFRNELILTYYTETDIDNERCEVPCAGCGYETTDRIKEIKFHVQPSYDVNRYCCPVCGCVFEEREGDPHRAWVIVPGIRESDFIFEDLASGGRTDGL